MQDNQNSITSKFYFITRKKEEENLCIGMHESCFKQIDYENKVAWYRDGGFIHFEKIRISYEYFNFTDAKISR